MKTPQRTLLILGLIFSAGLSAQVKAPVMKNKKISPVVRLAQTNTKLSTDVKFDGQLVGGQIQSPFETLTVVENEKSIDDLIGVRKNFSDRDDKSKGMR